MARKIIVANWKMNLGGKDGILFARSLFKELEHQGWLKKTSSSIFILCPPFTMLGPLSQLAEAPVFIGAQNCASYSQGAFTGEISASMIKDWGGQYVLLGHSERRTYFHETSEEIAKKIAEARHARITPVLCIGETLAEREAGRTEEVLQAQLKEALNSENGNDLILAYEPVWAIGTGKVPSTEEITKIHLMLHTLYPSASLLYGGSVDEKNIKEILTLPYVDGVLVGSASLSMAKFISLIRQIDH